MDLKSVQFAPQKGEGAASYADRVAQMPSFASDAPADRAGRFAKRGAVLLAHAMELGLYTPTTEPSEDPLINGLVALATALENFDQNNKAGLSTPIHNDFRRATNQAWGGVKQFLNLPTEAPNDEVIKAAQEHLEPEVVAWMQELLSLRLDCAGSRSRTNSRRKGSENGR